MVGSAGGVAARAAVKFDRVQVALAGEGGTTASGTADLQGGPATGSARTAAGQNPAAGGAGDAAVVLINRGDNLWTIARKLYGRGLRYTVIYDANRSQIRNPSLIYPGQVFTIPRPEEPENPENRG